MIIIDSNLWAMQFLKCGDLIRMKHMLLNQSYFIIVKMRYVYIIVCFYSQGNVTNLQERVLS